jgi:hypothetical protein
MELSKDANAPTLDAGSFMTLNVTGDLTTQHKEDWDFDACQFAICQPNTVGTVCTHSHEVLWENGSEVTICTHTHRDPRDTNANTRAVRRLNSLAPTDFPPPRRSDSITLESGIVQRTAG